MEPPSIFDLMNIVAVWRYEKRLNAYADLSRLSIKSLLNCAGLLYWWLRIIHFPLYIWWKSRSANRNSSMVLECLTKRKVNFIVKSPVTIKDLRW